MLITFIIGWRWIFIVQGIITSSVSIASFFFIPDFPEQTKMFTPEEKAVLLGRLRQDAIGLEVVHDRRSVVKYVLEALSDWKIWLAYVVFPHWKTI